MFNRSVLEAMCSRPEHGFFHESLREWYEFQAGFSIREWAGQAENDYDFGGYGGVGGDSDGVFSVVGVSPDEARAEELLEAQLSFPTELKSYHRVRDSVFDHGDLVPQNGSVENRDKQSRRE